MEILNYKKTEIQNSYVDFKASMDAVVERVEEGFVQIGYYLKIARDTQVLQESGYKSVTDFAAAEYGLDKSAVSRFIAINDRFAEDGYSDRLKDQYRGMGRAKLSVMLLLPEEITEELTPDYSKSDIQKIKDEVEEEKKVTDLEVMMEQQDFDTELLDNNLKRAMYQLGHDIPELHRKIWNVWQIWNGWQQTKRPELPREIMDILAPAGEGMHSVRVAGIGRLMITLHGADQDITLINVRSGEKEKYSWDDMMEAIGLLMEGDTPEESWTKTYGENSSVAPVQLDPKSKVTKAAEPKPGSQGAEKNIPENEEREEMRQEEAEQAAGVPEEIGPEQLPHGTSKGDGISWKEPEEKKEFREELPKKDAEYRVPIGSNLLKDIRSGQRFLILRTKDPFCVENIIHLFGQKNGEETGIEIDIQITHLIKDHGGPVPGYVAFQFEVIPAAPGQIPGQMEIGDMEKEEGVEPESGEETDAEAGVHGESAESDT
nr:MAG TPA: Protein of unknown function (DUF3102) [Caudoviricetes sp.]